MNKLYPSIKQRTPQVRCYKCGNEDIKEICHHCGRAMCAKHQQPKLPFWIGGTHTEFKNLGLSRHPAGNEGKHCEDCLHFSLNKRRWFFIGVILGLLIALFILLKYLNFISIELIWFVFWWPVFGGFLTLTFAIIRNHKKKYQYQPPLPITGQIIHIKAEEFIQGYVTLDKNGTYHTSQRSHRELGEIEVKIRLNSLDRTRLQRYKKKYDGKHELSPLALHAGFLILNGKPNIKIQSKKRHINTPPHTLALTGTARKNAFLMGSQVGGSTTWSQKYSYTYQQLPKRASEILPIQIIPRVVRQGNGWSLELLVQVTPGMGVKKLLNAETTIQELNIKYSPKWGRPESSNEVSKFTNSSEMSPYTSLTWKEIKISEKENSIQQDNKTHILSDSIIGPTEKIKHLDYQEEEISRKKSFVIRFERSLTPEITEEPIKGHIKLRFAHAFSGIDKFSYYYPTGKKHDLKKVKQELFSTVVIGFELNLESLCFQEPYSPKFPIISPEPNEIPPDYKMVKDLSDELAKDDVYVQRIIENEPRTNRATAKTINRYWRIEGRKYIGVYPIDFHIVITGKEHYDDKDTADRGEAYFEVKIFAMVFNNKMRREVQNFKDRLEVIIKWLLSMQMDDDNFELDSSQPTDQPSGQPPSGLPINGKRTTPRGPSSLPSPNRQSGTAYLRGE